MSDQKSNSTAPKDKDLDDLLNSKYNFTKLIYF